MSISNALTQAPMKKYQEHLERGELAYQYSLAANRPFFYPRVICPYSGTDAFEWRISKGLGTIYSMTALYPRNEPSYAVVLVDLDEGFRMMSRVVDATAEDVQIGARVRLSIRKAENGDACPFFVLESHS